MHPLERYALMRFRLLMRIGQHHRAQAVLYWALA
jgi:hypothetical protein